MKEILKNLALLDLLKFCREQGIACSGSYCVKVGRGFTYALVDEVTGDKFVDVTFHKSSVPTHVVHCAERKGR